MNVWILQCLADDRGGSIVGVYETEAAAAQALLAIVSDTEADPPFKLSEYEITEHKVEE